LEFFTEINKLPTGLQCLKIMNGWIGILGRY